MNPDGSASQVLAPIWWHVTRVGVRIYPRRDLPGAGGVRLPMLVSRHFRGVASIDVYPHPGPNPNTDRIVIRERYHAVENHVPFIPLAMATRIHLRAEAGTLAFPFPKGTGFAGLLPLLDAAVQKQ